MRHFIKIGQCAAVTRHRGRSGGVQGGVISVFKNHHVFLSPFKLARRRGGHKERGRGRGSGRARSGGAARTGEGLRCRSRRRRPLLFPLSCTFPIPPGFPQRWRSAAGPALSAHGGRGGGRAGAAAQAQRRGGEEAQWATRCTRKVAHGCKQQETSIGVSGGRPLPSHGWLEASAAERPDSRAGSLRPLGSLSSSPVVLLRTAPSPHPSLAPLRVATRDDEFSASRPVGGGGRGEWPRRRRGPTPVTAPGTRLSRRHCAQTTWVHP